MLRAKLQNKMSIHNRRVHFWVILSVAKDPTYFVWSRSLNCVIDYLCEVPHIHSG